MSHSAVSDTKLAVDGDDDVNHAAAAVLTLPQGGNCFLGPSLLHPFPHLAHWPSSLRLPKRPSTCSLVLSPHQMCFAARAC